MSKISIFAGVAIAAIGMASLSSGSAFASCLNTSMPTLSLTQSAVTPNVGAEYDRGAYDIATAKGNRCATTQQSYPTNDGSAASNDTNLGLTNSNNSSGSNGARGNGNGDQMRPGL